MLLQVELRVLVEELPRVHAAFTMDIHHVLGIFESRVALLQYEQGLLRVHRGYDKLCNQLLLDELVIEKVANL